MTLVNNIKFDLAKTSSKDILSLPNVSCTVVFFSPTGSITSINDEYLPYVITGLSMNNVSVLTLSAQAMCANPVSLETTRSQFFIIGKVSLIVNFSKDSHLSSTPESLNFLIKSISFIPPAK